MVMLDYVYMDLIGFIWGFPKSHGATPEWMVYNGKSHLEMDDSEVSPF